MTTPKELLARGMHPDTLAKLQKIGFPLELVGQCIGDAPLSANYHHADGHYTGLDGRSHPYTATFDIHAKDLTRAQMLDWSGKMSVVGICAFYRVPGQDGTPASWPVHAHCVDAGLAMKSALRGQIHDFMHGRNGLARHGPYKFFTPSLFAKNVISTEFLAAKNPAEG